MHRALLLLPLMLLVAAAVITNMGGGVAPGANAATVNVTGSIGADKHLAASLCTGGTAGETAGASGVAALDFTAMTANTSYTRTCQIGFGSTNSASVNMQVNAASATFGWAAPWAAQGACAAPTATNSRVGIDAAAAAGGTTNAAIDCATAGQYQSLPTVATTACNVTGQVTDATCTLAIMITTGAATPASVSNSSITVNAA
jgi:hypothetical protein